MSAGADMLNAGWSTLLDHHGVAASHLPAAGGSLNVLTVLDNGQPEAQASLAYRVTGISRVITATRGGINFAANDRIIIGTQGYRILEILNVSEQAVRLALGIQVVAGKQ